MGKHSHHNFHKENCSSCVRASFRSPIGVTFVLVGQHAFEWSIMSEDNNLTITCKTYPNGKKAREAWTELKKLHK